MTVPSNEGMILVAGGAAVGETRRGVLDIAGGVDDYSPSSAGTAHISPLRPTTDQTPRSLHTDEEVSHPGAADAARDLSVPRVVQAAREREYGHSSDGNRNDEYSGDSFSRGSEPDGDHGNGLCNDGDHFVRDSHHDSIELLDRGQNDNEVAVLNRRS